MDQANKNWKVLSIQLIRNQQNLNKKATNILLNQINYLNPSRNILFRPLLGLSRKAISISKVKILCFKLKIMYEARTTIMKNQKVKSSMS